MGNPKNNKMKNSEEQVAQTKTVNDTTKSNIDMNQHEMQSLMETSKKLNYVFSVIGIDISNSCDQLPDERLSNDIASFKGAITQLSLLKEPHFKGLVSANSGCREILKDSLIYLGHCIQREIAENNLEDDLKVAVIINFGMNAFHESHLILFPKYKESQIIKAYNPIMVEYLAVLDGEPLTVINTKLGLSPFDLEFRRVQEPAFFKKVDPTLEEIDYINSVNMALSEASNLEISSSIFESKFFIDSQLIVSGPNPKVDSDNESQENISDTLHPPIPPIEDITGGASEMEQDMFLAEVFSMMLAMDPDQLIQGIEFVSKRRGHEMGQQYLAELKRSIVFLASE